MKERVRCPRCWERFWTENDVWAKCPVCDRRVVLDESNPYMDGGNGPRWHEHTEFLDEEIFRPGWSM